MNRYQSSIRHVPFVLAAVALTAVTMGLAVVLPAKVDFPVHQARALAVSKASLPMATEVVISPARIDVVGERTQKTAFEPARLPAMPKRNQTS